MRDRVNLFATVSVLATITYFSLTRVPSPSDTGTGSGFVFPALHILAYFGLATALILYFHDTQKGHMEAVLTAGLFGLAMESIQFLIPYRSFTFFDAAVNFLGASVILLDHRSFLVTKVIRIEDRMIETAMDTFDF